MKFARVLILAACLIAVVAGSTMAQRGGRKLPLGTYIKSAKIEILSGDQERYKLAEAFLDSLFMHYGHHAEALYLMAQINVDYIEKTPDLEAKKPYVTKMVAYRDTLAMTCDNKDIKKKYRKDCKQFSNTIDSISVMYWREFYNGAVEQLAEIRTANEDMKADPDSVTQAFYREKRDAYVDSCALNMSLSILIDSTDYRAYVGLASMAEEREEFSEAIGYLNKALMFVDSLNRAPILLQAVYNHFNANEYCQSIPLLEEYCAMEPTDVDNLYNLSAVYNRCERYDDSRAVYDRILTVDSFHIDAIIGIGQYYNQMALYATDSAGRYRDEGNDAMVEEWQQKRNDAFANSKQQFARAFEIAPDNQMVASELGVVCYIIEDYECAIEAFNKLTQLEPGNADNWMTLGDCYLRMQQYDPSARAYEKVVEIDPENLTVWEKLKLLYEELNETENLARANEHLK